MKSKLNVFLISSLMLVFVLESCHKEDVQEETSVELINKGLVTLRSEQVNDLIQSDLNGYVTPDIETLDQILAIVRQDSLFNLNAQQIASNYGNMRINAALLTAADTDQFMVSIPFEKDRHVTAILYYITHEDHYHLALIPWSDVKPLLTSHTSELVDIDPLLSLALHDMHYYQIARLHKFMPEVNTFLERYALAIDGVAESRSITLYKGFVNVIEEHYFHLGEAITVTSQYVTWQLDCPGGTFGQGVPGGSPTHFYNSPLWFNPGGSGSNTETISPVEAALRNLEAIDPDCRDFVLSEDARRHLVESLENTSYPCSGKTTEEFLEELINKLCYEVNPAGADIIAGSNGNGEDTETSDNLIITIDDVNRQLDGVDKINVHPNLAAACPKFACIWDNMVNGGLSTELVCQIASLFEGDNSATNLNLFAQDYSTDSNKINANIADTSTKYETKTTSIYINTLECNNLGEMEIFETLQHELIHAMIQTTLVREFGWDASQDPLSFSEAFRKMTQGTFGANPTEAEHKLMLDRFLIPMINSLQEMNGNLGTYADFLGIVLAGFPEQVLIWGGYNPIDVKQQAHASRAIFNNPANLINGSLLGCN